MERIIIYLAAVAAVALVLSSSLLVTKHHLLRASCSDVRAFARDVRAAFASRGVIAGTYRFDHPVTVNTTGIYCPECLVAVTILTVNETVLYGRQRLIIAAINGTIKLHKL